MTQGETICIRCPLGCRVTSTIGPDGSVQNVKGNQCKGGKTHAIAEIRHPVRVLTTTVLVEGGSRCLLPARTDKPVSRDRHREIMRATSHIRVRPPVKVGQEIAHDILGTGANLISTSTV